MKQAGKVLKVFAIKLLPLTRTTEELFHVCLLKEYKEYKDF